MVVKGHIYIASSEYVASSITVKEKINEPAVFEALLRGKQAVALDGLVEIYRDTTKFFKGILEQRRYDILTAYVETVVKGRSDFGKLASKVQAPITWTNQKVTTVIGDILTGSGVSKGTVTDPYSIFHKWSQTTDTDFNSDLLSNVSVVGTGSAAKVILSAGVAAGYIRTFNITPANLQTWKTLYASTTKPGYTNINFDILDSSDNVIPGYGGITTDQLPKDISGINPATYPTIRVRANLTTTAPGDLYYDTGSTWNQGYPLRSGSYIRQAQRITIADKNITQVASYCKKVGSPTGTITCHIRRVSDDVSLGSVSKNVSTLPTDFDWITWLFSSPIYVNQEVRISWEYSGGDANNYAYFAGISGGGKEGVHSVYVSSWTDYSTEDMLFRIYTRPTPELLDWAVTHYADYLTLTVDYQSKAQLIMALAEWLNGEFQTTTTGTLDFKTQLGTDRSATITLTENNCRISSRTIDNSLQTDKVYGIGSGSGGSRIEATYGEGTKESVYTDKDIDDSAFLTNILEKILTARASAVETLEATLTESDSWGLNLGDTVKVNFPSLDISNVNYRIVELERTFTDEGDEQVRLVLANYQITLLEREMRKLLKLESWAK